MCTLFLIRHAAPFWFLCSRQAEKLKRVWMRRWAAYCINSGLIFVIRNRSTRSVDCSGGMEVQRTAPGSLVWSWADVIIGVEFYMFSTCPHLKVLEQFHRRSLQKNHSAEMTDILASVSWRRNTWKKSIQKAMIYKQVLCHSIEEKQLLHKEQKTKKVQQSSSSHTCTHCCRTF